MSKIFAGIPVYNAEDTIYEIILEILQLNLVEKIIVILDGCTDRSEERLITFRDHLIIINHAHNQGYGSAQKSIFNKFLELSSAEDILINIHADGQTPPSEIIEFINTFSKYNTVELVLGSRILGKTKTGYRRTFWRTIGDHLMTKIGNFLINAKLSTYASGFRSFKRNALITIPYQSFSDYHFFDIQLVFEAHLRSVKYIEIPVGIYPSKNQKKGVIGIKSELKSFLFYISKFMIQFIWYAINKRFL